MTVAPYLLLWGLIAFSAVLLLCVVVLVFAFLHLRDEHRRLARRQGKLSADLQHLTLKTGRLRTGEQPTVRRRTPPPAPGTTPTSTGRHHRIG
jgi:hypothetical protein